MGEFNYKYIFSFQGFCNGLIVIFTYITIYNSYKENSIRFTEASLFSKKSYTDLSDNAYYYNNYFSSKSVLVAFLIIRCFTIFCINKRFNILIKTIESAQKDIFNYSMILFPMLLGFALLAQSIYGHAIIDFSSYGRAFISILLLTTGQVGWQAMVQVAPTVTLPFLLIFYIIIVNFLMSLFHAIYIDNYRTVVLELGFLYEKEPSWGLKDYFRWMLNWVPKKCFRALGLTFIDDLHR